MYLFPFEAVERNSKIIIYGAGRVGKTYLTELKITKFCDVICMIDKKPEYYKNLNVKILKMDAICDMEYDYIVIAIASKAEADIIRETLIKYYNVPDSKVVYKIEKIEPEIINKMSFLISNPPHQGKYLIAIHLTGGFGDHIIRKENVREVTKWDEDILLDIYVNKSKLNFAKILFSDIPGIHHVFPDDDYNTKKYHYMIALYFDLILLIDSINEEVLMTVPYSLKKIIQKIKKSVNEYWPNPSLPFALHYSRCEFDGMNCYTSYSRYGVFHEKKMKTTIPMLSEFADKFREYKLGKYVTFNYGWDHGDRGSMATSAKAWPFEYFEQLARLFKERYPNVRIVQIGLLGTPKMNGVDVYICNESIELVKYVLQGSMLHIDCEGGMVHLATQLETKCVVLFGPTPVTYYGYSENINILSNTCKNCCWLALNSWECWKKLEKPECMWSIKPEIVMGKIAKYLDDLSC